MPVWPANWRNAPSPAGLSFGRRWRDPSECLEGRKRLHEHFESEPFPHFEPHLKRPRVYSKIDAELSVGSSIVNSRRFVHELRLDALPLDRRDHGGARWFKWRGKTTFYKSFVAAASLRFVNADVIAAKFGIDSYAIATVAASLADELVGRSRVRDDLLRSERRQAGGSAACGRCGLQPHVVLCRGIAVY